MSSPAECSLAEVLAGWETAGFVGEFSVAGQTLLCGRCVQRHDPQDAHVVDIARFEGLSDPDDEAIAFALVCAACGARGTLVAAYGPMASAEEAAMMTALTDSRRA